MQNRAKLRRWAILSFLLSCAVIFIRKPGAFLNPQFWAEDGVIFFAQAYHNGIASFLQPYAGYLHFYPRLIAFLADFFHVPLSLLPAVYNYGWLLAFSLTFFYIWFRLDGTVYEKFLLSAVLAVIPTDNEIFMTLTNSQWLLAPALILVASAKPLSPRQCFADYAITALASLSGLFCVLFFPFFAWNAYKSKSKHDCILLLIVWVSGMIQVILLATTPRMQVPGEFHLFNPGFIDVFYKQYSYLIFGPSLAGASGIFKLSYLGIVAAVLAVVGMDFYRKKNKLGLLMLLSGILVLLGTVYSFRNNPGILYPVGHGSRYFYIPGVMFFWSLIMFGRPARMEQFKKYIIVLPFLFIVYYFNFRDIPAFVDLHWAQWAREIPLYDTINIPVNPPGWGLIQINNKQGK